MAFLLNRPPEDVADLSIRKGQTSLANEVRGSRRYHQPRSRLVLLVHGFNVSEDAALASLGSFRASIADQSQELASQSIIFTWPGDWPFPVIGPLAYPRLVPVARDGAPILMEELHALFSQPGAPRELVIVAHSLGCRLILEMLECMAGRGRPKGLERLIVILMAAAVPVHLKRLMEAALSVSDAIVLLHSPADTVLRDAFPPGQTLFWEGQFMPEAVGLRGLPKELGWATVLPMHGYDHSDYWIDHEAPAVICGILAHFLPGLAVRQPRPAPSRPPEHRLPTTALLAEHISRW